MKKTVCLLVIITMICIVFAGCVTQKTETKMDNKAAVAAVGTHEPTQTADNTDAAPDIGAADSAVGDTASARTVSEAYTAYTDMKAVVLTRLGEALAKNIDTVWASLSLLDVVSADLTLLPVSLFGSGEESVAAGMAFMGMTGIEYSENGNSYSIKYSEKEGGSHLFSGTYNAPAEALVCTGSKNGEETIYSEYCKTPFGYVAQYYIVNEEGTASLYQLSLSGEDGVVGISNNGGRPSALTGSEAADFPKTCPEWYAITGKTVTGLMSDGGEVSFEYTPTSAE